jgi:alpha-L-fucosidase 2
MSAKYYIVSILVTISVAGKTIAQSTNTLWYNQPARYFEESLVLGNGKMGASVFGGVNSDMIYLNDATLWSGEPVNPNMNPEAYKNLPAIREALKNENYKLADELNHKLQGKFSESYAPLGSLYINFKNTGEPINYYRELNISEAISKVSYEVNGVKFTREYFISYPDQVMVIKLTSSKKGALNFDVKFESLLKNTVAISDNILSANGTAPVHTEPNYRGNMPDAVIFDDSRGTRFTNIVKIKNKDGAIVSTEKTLGLKDGTEAVIFISIATSFNGFDKNPATEGLKNEDIANNNLAKAFGKDYNKIKEAHLLDYQKYFSRVSLDLGSTTAPNLPTNERLKRYANGAEDKNLEILYFQFGRYLLISSSRTPGVPANLQGIWNPYMRPPWSSNYTTNINAEENYWLAENTNLSEMHLPMMKFIQNVSKTGAVTAKTFYGANGWVACHNSDIWAMSNPVGDFGSGDPSWANWNMGGAWLSTHLWEHFVFTQDLNFLKNEGYNTMRGSAEFCLEWLVEDKNGNLITSPSTSPENIYITPLGYRGATLYGGTADLAMIRECFEQTIKASVILNIDADFRAKLEKALARLYPYQIGKKGNLQEWYYDWEDAEPQHRHQSHLFGLYPGHQITPEKTPELAAACRKTLEIKGDQTTGWSKGWRINLWARLEDGNRAYKMYRELLHYVEPDSVKTTYSGGGGTYPNLFDAHPPFQIDGNFGGAAAVAEMLVQSDPGEIRLLPALPDTWDKGYVKGICARGGFVISMDWSNKTLNKLTVFAREGGSTKLISGGKQKEITLKKGEDLVIAW